MKTNATIGQLISGIALVLSLVMAPALSQAADTAAAAAPAASGESHNPTGQDGKDKPDEAKGEESEAEKSVQKIADRLMKEGGKLTEAEEKQLKEMDGEELSKILQSDKFKELFKNFDAATAQTLMGQIQRTISFANPVAKQTMAPILAANGQNVAPGPSMASGTGLNGTIGMGTPSAPNFSATSPVGAPATSSYGSGFSSTYSGPSGSRTTPNEVAPVLPSAPSASTGSSLQFNETNPVSISTVSTPIQTTSTASTVTSSVPTQAAATTTAAVQQVQALDRDYMDKIASPAPQTSQVAAPSNKYGDTGFVVKEFAAAAPAASTKSSDFFRPTGAQSDATSSTGPSARGAVSYADSNAPAQPRRREVGEAREVSSGPRYQFDARGVVQSSSNREDELFTETTPTASEEPKARRQVATGSSASRKAAPPTSYAALSAKNEGLNIQFSEEVPKAKVTKEARTPAAESQPIVRAGAVKLDAGYAAASLPVPFSGTLSNSLKSGLAPAAIKNPTATIETTTIVAATIDESTPLTKLIKGAQAAQ